MIENIPSNLTIYYKDNEGNITKRTISNINLEDNFKITAFCNLRNDNRTFKIANIVSIVDPKTGNVERNPWKYFGLTSKIGIEALAHPILPAIKALKIFSKLIRGFSKRERIHIVHFILNTLEIKNYSEEIVDEWLHKLFIPFNWDECINVYEFTESNTFPCLLPLIKEIPDELMLQCRETAFKIAKGSGRRQMPVALINWIQSEFVTPQEKKNGYDKNKIYFLSGKESGGHNT